MNNKTEFLGNNFCHRTTLFYATVIHLEAQARKHKKRIHLATWSESLCATDFVEGNTSEIVTVADDCVNTIT